ncbi:MAG: Hpt domain-containing protein [Hydrogenimonas sp.]|nr:Hpt domain-containing protein [Hydrogenimonas sp.]
MLIYRNDGKLFCISKKALKLAGYHDIEHFNDEHNDYSELFLKRPGYIYNFEAFSWLIFLKNASKEQKRVLISTRDNAIYECELELEIVYPAEFHENTPEFFYQVDFKNLRLADGTQPYEEPKEPFNDMESASVLSLQQFEKEEELENPVSDPFATSAVEEEIQISATSIDIDEKKEVSFSFEEEEAKESSTEEKSEEPLDLVDFSFDTDIEKDRDISATQKESQEEDKEVRDTPEIGLKIDAFTKSPKESATLFDESESKKEIDKPLEFDSGLDSKPKPVIAIEKNIPDTKRIAATLGLSENRIKEFIKEFLETYVEYTPEIEAAISVKNIFAAKKEALKIKGVAANLGMDSLTENIDKALSANEPEEFKNIWIDIDSYMRSVASFYAPDLFNKDIENRQQAWSKSGATELDTDSSEDTKETQHVSGSSSSLRLEGACGGESINFNPDEAAEALGLPESLILEFVNDFIEQARDEKKRFEDAYERADIGTINEVAHKLKGVAANLRIEDMRALMESVQHAKDLEEVEKELIKFYHKLAALAKMMAKEYT